jgi:hypothetical protein
MRLTCFVAFDAAVARDGDAGFGCWPHAIPKPASAIAARIHRLAAIRFIVFSM